MIKAVSDVLSRLVQRYLPDPMVFALILTALVFVLGLVITHRQVAEMVGYWGDGFWNLLGFSMQMALILVTGHALASSPAIRRCLTALAQVAKNPGQAVMLVTLVAALASLINWGFCLVVGVMLAKEVARRVKGCDYGLLIAAGYIGMMPWHGGFSGSVPLLAATKGNPMEKTLGLIPVTETLFAPFNLFITGMLIICLPILTRLMLPKPGEARAINPALLAEPPPRVGTKAGMVPAQRFEESPVLSWLAGLLGAAYLIEHGLKAGFRIDINTVNLVFLMAGLVLQGSPMGYMRAVAVGAREIGGIVIQFPFYAGIQAMTEQSGLGGVLTNGFIDIANRDTFPVFAFLSSGLINFAVPSGGGHWVVQAPFVMPAAQALGADRGKAAMAIAYGEEWMNMAQPFWALPALSIARLGVRDIMGYCVTALLFTAAIFIVGLYLF